MARNRYKMSILNENLIVVMDQIDKIVHLIVIAIKLQDLQNAVGKVCSSIIL